MLPSEVVLEVHFRHPKRDVTLNKYLVLIGKGLFPQGLRLICLEQYFTANDIQNAQKQPAIFTSAWGASTYVPGTQSFHQHLIQGHHQGNGQPCAAHTLWDGAKVQIPLINPPTRIVGSGLCTSPNFSSSDPSFTIAITLSVVLQTSIGRNSYCHSHLWNCSQVCTSFSGSGTASEGHGRPEGWKARASPTHQQATRNLRAESRLKAQYYRCGGNHNPLQC